MELRKYVYKSYRAPPRIKFKKVLNDDLFFKRILSLKMALNKNIKINTNYRIERLKKGNNLSKIENEDDSEESFENREIKKLLRKPNILCELEDIITANNKKTEKFIRSFKGLKEKNKEFLTGYNYVKIPVEKRIRNFILDTVKLFQDNHIQINFRTKINKNHNKLEKENDDINELWTQNKASIKLFKQDPFIVKGERGVYFYYVSNHQGEKLDVKNHKYIKYLNQVKEYLEEVKDEKFSEFPRKKRKDRVNKTYIQKTKRKTRNKDDDFNLIENESSKLKLDTNKSNRNINNINKKNKSNSNNNSKNKQPSRNNSAQEYPSKDFVNIRNKIESKNNNLYNIYLQNSENSKNFNLSNFSNKTPIKRNSSNPRITKKNTYIKYENDLLKDTEESKLEKQLNRPNSIKDYTSNLNSKNSFQDTNYSINKINKKSSENLPNFRQNVSKIYIKKYISSKMNNNFGNILSRNTSERRSAINLNKYMKDIKLYNKTKNAYSNLKIRSKKVNYNKTFKYRDRFKFTKDIEISPKKIKKEHNLTEIYERARKNNRLSDDENIKEINEYLKKKGLNNDDILKGIQFNSDKVFNNLKEKANKLNIEAKTKAFFYGIIPNKRKKKLKQLREINTKINKIEREYIRALIDRDLTFIK